MAEFRTVYCKIWDDEWFCELDADGKILFLYLLTNHRASVTGMYKLTVRSASFETSIPKDRVTELFTRFSADGKIEYESNIVWIKRMRTYQATTSPKVLVRIEKDLAEIPAYPIKYRYLDYYDNKGIDTHAGSVSIPMPKLMSETETETCTDTCTETETEHAESLLAYKAWNEVSPGTLNALTKGKIDAMVRMYGVYATIGAMKSTTVYTMNYIQGILRNSKSKGTIGELEAIGDKPHTPEKRKPDYFDRVYAPMHKEHEDRLKAQEAKVD